MGGGKTGAKLEVLKLFLILFFLLVVQLTLVPFIAISGIAPDLILIFIIKWAGRKTPAHGVMLGFFAGLFQDMASVSLMGVFTLSKAVAGYLSCLFPWGRDEKNIFFMGAVLVAVTFVHQLISTLFQSLNSAAGFPLLFLRYGLPVTLYTGIFGSMVYVMIHWISKFRVRR